MTAGSTVTTYAYDELDRLKECAYPAGTGVKHTYSYNEPGWLSAVNVTRNTTTTLGSFAYSFSTASGSLYPGRTGARTGVSENLNGSARTVAYNYDPLFRLTREDISAGSPSGTITYDSTSGYSDGGGFDKVGNCSRAG